MRMQDAERLPKHPKCEDCGGCKAHSECQIIKAGGCACESPYAPKTFWGNICFAIWLEANYCCRSMGERNIEPRAEFFHLRAQRLMWEFSNASR